MAERRRKTGGIRCALRGAHSEITLFIPGGGMGWGGLKNIWTGVYKMPLARLFLSPIVMVYSQLLCICLGFHGDQSWRGESRSPSVVTGSVTCAASRQPLTPSHCFLILLIGGPILDHIQCCFYSYYNLARADDK